MLALLLKPSAYTDEGMSLTASASTPTLTAEGIRPVERTWLRLWVSRVLKMTLLWFGFGIALGASFGMAEGDLAGLLGFLVAGVIVVPPFGFLVGLLGAHWIESLVGAVAGWLVGIVLAFVSGTAEGHVLAGTWFVMGGLIGATCPELWRRFRRVRNALAAKRPAAAGVH